MTRNGPVGRSGYTREKQEVFREILHRHIGKVKGILSHRERLHRRYTYLDLTSGSGSYSVFNEPVIGSPVIAMQEALAHEMAMDAFLIESNKKTCDQLKRTVSSFMKDEIPGDNINARIIQGEWETKALEALASLDGRRLGIVYLDPNGVPLFDSIGALAKHSSASRLDFIINVSATSYKRTMHLDWRRSRLIDDIDKIDRKYKYIREPSGKHQWTFIIATNYPSLMSRRRLESLQIYQSSTPDGQRIAEKISETSRNIRGKGQLKLF